MNIDFANLQKQYQLYKEEIDEAIQSVLNKSNYIMGEEVQALEYSLESFTKVKYAIACGSGTDALLLSLMALGIGKGDEVITTPFTFIATAEAIALLGARPVFVDINEKTYNIDATKIEESITKRTKALLLVSLFGQAPDFDAIEVVSKRYKLKVIIDGAQSFGSQYKGSYDCTFGDIAITSFFPAKPLGCYGDGGAVFTNSEVLSSKVKALRIHGQSQRYKHKYIGMGARMDTIQAAILNVKLKYYQDDLNARQKVASWYNEQLVDSNVILPYILDCTTSTFAQYSIRVQDRDAFQKKLQLKGIPTAVHYPLPLHLQECFSYLNYKKGDFPISERVSWEILSLPMNPYLTKEEIVFISQEI